MACYDFCSILNFLGSLFFVILAIIVGSGYHYQEWDINDPDKSKTALYISALIHFIFFLACLGWKFYHERKMRNESVRLENAPVRYFDDNQELLNSSDRNVSLQPILGKAIN